MLQYLQETIIYAYYILNSGDFYAREKLQGRSDYPPRNYRRLRLLFSLKQQARRRNLTLNNF